ncbi:dihydroxyacetone kinase subunit DhaL [Actinoplanes xinjiangensis]|uniref:Dihydroxyacetone kinase-like protein n=1 Tax=Actinoplanes xinjiangensis TaxID=512350 RepID=A0A316FV21_9ACTN|nr:dihydroxyacetone kinase subunit DhaL [Actinoplanes xinjiangensis]PWK52634.1 dihydroxyacetone kinase-like protein [Actinoplanes xinjiangensis]GIF36669.1 dihydroxyacetone kinase subunit L [Actinoplanes xinjiangensis]
MDVALATAWLRAVAESVDADADELTKLDSAIGDGDHGVNLRRGFTAVAALLDGTAFTSVGDVFVRAGGTLISKVGGASGPLYGSAFRAVGKALPPGPAVTPADLVTALRAGLDAVSALGGAVPGDKTIVDAYRPAVMAFGEAVAGGAALPEAAAGAARAAGDGARATVSLTARKGRASYLGERSAGHQDPGATSTWLIFQALADVTAP